MKDRDIFALAALQCVRGLNAAVLLPLLRMLGGARRVWEAPAAELAAAGMERRTLAALERYRAKHAQEPERIAVLCAEQAVSLVALGEAAQAPAFRLLEACRRAGLKANMDYAGRSMKAQMKQANKAQARFALILGEEEVKESCAQLKDMEKSEQQKVPFDKMIEKLKELLGKQ